MTETELPTPERRTKRRYAYELFPEPEEGATHSLADGMPHLYARAIGFSVQDTGWTDIEPRTRAGDRVMQMLSYAQIAFLADALLQGMTGDDAWRWADAKANEEAGEWLWERAEVYGVDPEQIKPYPCGPEPEHHYHFDPARPGTRYVVRADMPESKCELCTEPVETDEARDRRLMDEVHASRSSRRDERAAALAAEARS
ncbi:hypothetical protein [Rathayibacter sp. AY1E1]|uniref:hypothetical protein n=1 Tax=Rathayibacter sp. AY1E1 TaxID=2080549 RepID=UPI000CE93582|nr:hypothetical protein [Rathayibacter sp. AY1E1]PPH51220.1 hypothetical protein C5C67_11940 [Rathayibacter sp. AY1E1]